MESEQKRLKDELQTTQTLLTERTKELVERERLLSTVESKLQAALSKSSSQAVEIIDLKRSLSLADKKVILQCLSPPPPTHILSNDDFS
jgi:hypothetical protein